MYQSGDYRPDQEPMIRFDAITEAWGHVRENMGVWVGASFVTALIPAVISGISQMVTGSRQPQAPEEFLPVLAISLGANIIQTVLSAYLMGGMYHMALKQLRGEPIAVSDVFSCGNLIAPLIIASLLVSLGTSFGAIFCLLPGMLLGALWMLTNPLIVDKGLGAVEAMQASFNAIKPVMWSALGYMIVLSLASCLGMIGCGIGVLFTLPLFPLGMAIVYRDFFPERSGGVQ